MLKKVLFIVAAIAMAFITFVDHSNAEELYQKFQPKTTSRVRESTEWSTTYTFNSTDIKTPRVLLIGDSICNGYQRAVTSKLKGKMNVTFWASSKCVTDRDFFRELDLMLSANKYNVITFNNGLHSLGTDLVEWEAAFRGAVRFIKAKCPDAKLFICNCTPLKDPKLTEKSRKLNSIAERIAAEEKCSVIDLFNIMAPLSRDEFWSDTFHFKPTAIEKQADKIVETIL